MKAQKDLLIVISSFGVIVLAFFYIVLLSAGPSQSGTFPREPLSALPVSISVPRAPSSSVPQSGCQVQERNVTVNGTSLSGFIAPGTTLTVLSGYYACHDPKPGDVVIYMYGGSSAGDLLIKIVKGVPGDKISFQKAGGAWNILVNGAVLLTSAAIPYAITGQVFETFSRFVNGMNGAIPPDEYLILGNLPAGSRDSTRFGFVWKKDLIGKVAQ